MNIGNQIKNLRLSRGLKQEDLAKHLQVSTQAVSKWETGASMPDITLLPAIATFLGVTIDELFAMPEAEQYDYIESLFWSERRIPQPTFENAQRFLQEQILKDADNVRALTDMAYLFISRAESDCVEASEYAKRALAIDPLGKTSWVAFKEANHALSGDEWLDNHYSVIEFCKQMLEKQPDNYWALRTVVENMIADQRYEEASDYLEALRQAAPEPEAVRFYEGDVEYGRGHLDTALQLWDKAIEENPNRWQSYCSRADRIKKLGRVQEAIADYEKCMEVQSAPRLTDGLYSLAQIHEQIGEFEAAICDNERIIQVLAVDYGTTTGEGVDSRKREIERLQRRLENDR